MNPQVVIAIIVAALPLIPMLYEAIKLTVDFIKKLVEKKKCKMAMVQVAPIIEEAFKNGEIATITPEQLQMAKNISPDTVATVELSSDDKVKKNSIKFYDKVDDIVISQLKANNGVIKIKSE